MWVRISVAVLVIGQFNGVEFSGVTLERAVLEVNRTYDQASCIAQYNIESQSGSSLSQNFLQKLEG